MMRLVFLSQIGRPLCNAIVYISYFFFFSSRRRHTRFDCDWSSDVCSSDLLFGVRVYPLRGKHADAKKVRCEDCHTGVDLYKDKTKTTCIGCHQKDDKHRGVEGNLCEQCHLETDWKTTKDRFDHGLTRFPLLGKHADAKKIKCEDCHKSQAYASAPRDCWSCHEKDDKKSHKRRLGKLCEPCHNAVDWKRWDFDHDTKTRFKLDGAHKKLNCYDCHSKPGDDAKLP